MNHTIPSLVFVLSFSAVLASQEPQLTLLGASSDGGGLAEDGFVRPAIRSWPAALGRTGMFGRSGVGRLTRNAVPDVVLLDGTRPVVATAPGLYRAVTLLPGVGASDVVRDVAVIVGRGRPDGSRPELDALAMVGDQGLRAWRSNQDASGFEVAQLAASGWQGVQWLATHPGDDSVIFGLDAAGVVHLAMRQGQQYDATATLPGQPSPLSLCAVDWNGDGLAEAVELTSSGIAVVDRSAGIVCTVAFPAPITTGRLARVRMGSAPHSEWVACLARDGAGARLWLFRSGAAFDFPLYRDFVDIAAGDFNIDGKDELFLSAPKNEDVTVLMNIGSLLLPPVQPFLYHEATAFRVAVAVAGSCEGISAAAVGDFDGDGDTDILVGIDPMSQAATTMTLVRSKLFDSASLVAPTSEPRYEPTVNGIAHFTIEFTSAPGGTHTELAVWQDQSLPGMPTQMLPIAVYRERLPHQLAMQQRITFGVDGTHLLADGLYLVMLRPVTMQDGRVVEAGKAWFGACAATYTAALRAFSDGGGGNVRVGGITPQPDLPPPPGGQQVPPGTGN